MTTPAIILLLLSATLHALWNFLLKHSREKYIAIGWQFLGEKMGGMRMLGSIVIFAGILTIALLG